MSVKELNKIDEVICPCEKQEEIIASEIGENLKCPKCNANLKQRAYLPFLESVSYTHLPSPRDRG